MNYNNKIKFDGAGRAAEVLAVEMLALTFEDNLDEQYKDRDGTDTEGFTYSIKDQLESSMDYGSITAEYELRSSKSSEMVMAGNLLTNQTDYYLWLVHHNGKNGFLVMESNDFKEFVLANAEKWLIRRTKSSTVNKNSQLGRTFNMSSCYAVPVDELVKQEFTLFVEIPSGLYKQYIQLNKEMTTH